MNNATMSRGAPYFDLWAAASKTQLSDEELREIVEKHFPLEN